MNKKTKQLAKPTKEVSPDIVYQEMYQELRRFRDYELTVSAWYTTILIAIAGAVFTSSNFQSLLSSWLLKIIISIVIILIAFSSINSILYVRSRYSQIRSFVDDTLEPSWKDLDPKNLKWIRPYKLILITQAFLVVLIVLAIVTL